MPTVRLVLTVGIALTALSGIVGHHRWSGPALVRFGFDRGVTVGDLAVLSLAIAASAVLWAARRPRH